MALKPPRRADVWSGVLFVLIGAGFLLASRGLAYGSASAMGPAFFPVWLGALSIVLGAVLAGRGVLARAPEAAERMVVRPVILVLSAIAAFTVLLEPAGLVGASVALVAVASRATERIAPRPLAVTTVLLVAGATLLFVQGLSLPIPLWPAFSR